jgi:hypothetical protein
VRRVIQAVCTKGWFVRRAVHVLLLVQSLGHQAAVGHVTLDTTHTQLVHSLGHQAAVGDVTLDTTHTQLVHSFGHQAAVGHVTLDTTHTVRS